MKIILNNIAVSDQFEAVAAANALGEHKDMVVRRNGKYFYVKRNKASITVSNVKSGNYEDWDTV